MAHFALIRADVGAWAVATVVDPAEFWALDEGRFKSINGDDGGTWNPAAFVSIGGAGVQLTGANHSIAAGGTLTAHGILAVPNGGAISVASAGAINLEAGSALMATGSGAGTGYLIQMQAGAGIQITGIAGAHGAIDLAGYTDVKWANHSTAAWASGATATWASGSTSTWASGAVLAINTTTSGTGAVYLEKVGSASNHVLLNGEGLAITGIVGDHGTLELIDYVDLEVDNHATVLWKFGSTLDTAAGAVSTFAGTTSFTGTFRVAAGATSTIEARTTLLGDGQIVERVGRITSDATPISLSGTPSDTYFVMQGTLTGSQAWNLGETPEVAPVGATITCASYEPTHVVTVHGALQNWTLRYSAGLIYSRIFKRVNDGLVDRWICVAESTLP